MSSLRTGPRGFGINPFATVNYPSSGITTNNPEDINITDITDITDISENNVYFINTGNTNLSRTIRPNVSTGGFSINPFVIQSSNNGDTGDNSDNSDTTLPLMTDIRYSVPIGIPNLIPYRYENDDSVEISFDEDILDMTYRDYIDNIHSTSTRVLDRNTLNDDSVSLVLENPVENFGELYRKNIQKLKEKTDISRECVICIDESPDILYMLCCNNSVCYDCISKWLSENDSCPHCRAKSPPIHDIEFIKKSSEFISLEIEK